MTERPLALLATIHGEDLLRVLRAAVDGAPHWRTKAKRLLAEIEEPLGPLPNEEDVIQ